MLEGQPLTNFRICQEALSDVLHYAEATSVKIIIDKPDKLVCLSISDNCRGRQIAPGDETPAIREIKERIVSIDGQLSINFVPGQGTTISICI